MIRIQCTSFRCSTAPQQKQEPRIRRKWSQGKSLLICKSQILSLHWHCSKKLYSDRFFISRGTAMTTKAMRNVKGLEMPMTGMLGRPTRQWRLPVAKHTYIAVSCCRGPEFYSIVLSGRHKSWVKFPILLRRKEDYCVSASDDSFRSSVLGMEVLFLFCCVTPRDLGNSQREAKRVVHVSYSLYRLEELLLLLSDLTMQTYASLLKDKLCSTCYNTFDGALPTLHKVVKAMLLTGGFTG